MTQARHDTPCSRVTCVALGLLVAGLVSACGGGPSFPDWARVCGRHCAGAPVQAELGSYETCLRYAGGAMICWGDVRGSIEDVSPAAFDQLSYDPLNQADPRRATRLVPGMLEVHDMSCLGAGCCSLQANDSIWCWGRAWVSTFATAKPGIEHPRADDRIPEPVPGLEHVRRFIPGSGVEVDSGHEVFILGGMLIDATVAEHRVGEPAPTMVSGCKLIEHQVYCGGDNNFGQRGLGYISDGEVDPNYGRDVPVIGIDDAIGVAAFGVGRCALRATGEVWCWGSYVPPDPDAVRGTPIRVDGLDHIVDLQAGRQFFCALREDHQLLCWGNNSNSGILHTTPGGQRWQPYPVPDATDVVFMDISGGGICVIRLSGEVACNGGFPPEVTEPEGWVYGDLVPIPNLPDLPEDFPDEPTRVPEEPFDFDAAGPPGEPNFITFP